MNEPVSGKRAKRSKSRPADLTPDIPNTPGDLFWEIDKHPMEFEQNLVGVVIIRADGTIAHTNTYFAGLLGGLPADLVDKRLLDFVPEKDKATGAKAVRTYLSGEGHSGQFEIVVNGKDGKPVDLLVNAMAGAFQGQPATIGVFIDITDRKQAEADLRTSVAEYTNALSIAQAGEWEYDVATDRVTFNDNFYRLFGTSAEVVGGYTMSSADYTRRFLHPDDREVVGAEIKAAVATSDPDFSRILEHRVLYGDGTSGYILVRVKIDKDQAGRTIKVHGISQDVTRLKQAEDEVINLSRFPLENPNPVLRFSSDGTITFANAAARPLLDLWGCEVGQPLPDDWVTIASEVRSSGMNKSVEVTCGARVYSVTLSSRPGDEVVNAYGLDITAAKHAEDALRVSEAEFRNLAESMPQIVWITRPDGWNIYFNQQWIDYTGMTLEESKGHGWNKPFHPDDQKKAWDAWQNATKNNGVYSIESRLRRFDGIYRWWLVRGVPLFDDGGNILKWFGTCTDIHDLKSAEQALANSESKLETALSNMSQGLVMIDAEGKLVLHNSRLEEIYRLPPELIKQGMTVADAMALGASATGVEDVNLGATLAELAKVLDDPAGGTQVQRLSDGRSIAETYQPMPDGGVVVTFEDITKRKEAEQARAASELKLQTALSNMSQGLVMHDEEGRMILSNPRFAEIFGMPPDKVLPGMTIPELMGLSVSSSGVRILDPEGTIARAEDVLRGGDEGSYTMNMSDGRSLTTSLRRMPNGGVIVTFEDITQRLAVEAEAQRLAKFDALTDLPNRASFYDQMDTILKQLPRGESIGVLSLDLDRFKAVNDTLGHPIGDRLLQAAAQRVEHCLREGDIAARLGADEFAILQIPIEQPIDITTLANRLIEAVGARYDFDRNQVIVGVSVGVAVAPNDGRSPDTLMKNADLALDRAKADGGGVYRFFEPEMDARMQARHIIELNLRKAIENGGEFELFYQPIVDVKTGKVASCEALLRWSSPERGLMMPGEFIPVAEATGLIVPLSEWVLRQACVEAARWPEEITVAVNLSPVQFTDMALVQSIKQALADSGLPASRLELEITERVLMDESGGAFAILHQIRDLGIKISMDDFGTGYSSIGYLRAFPFSTIKIDQSFIRDLPGKKDSIAIVRAVVALSNSLGMQTIAEGVETEEQLAGVTSEGCDLVQGFFFSKPRPSTEVKEFFKAQAAKAMAAFPVSEDPTGD